MANIGLPSINIIFLEKAQTIIRRSEKGIVMMILKDSDTVGGNSFTYTSFDQVTEVWTADNKKYLEMCFMGNPNKVYVERVLTSTTDLSDTLKKVSNKRWNYLAVPDATSDDNTAILAWIKTKRNTDFKIYKYVGGGLTAPDDKGIINWNSDNVTIDGAKYAKQKYTARIAGICAGVPLNQSLTYYQLSEVEGFDELADDTARNAAIAAGNLIAINDGEKIKIARGVNSKTTTTATEGDLFKKIRNVETIDTIREDINTTIRDEWVGKYTNIYDNKLLLSAAITTYLSTLADDDILDPDFNNVCEIDFEAQRKFLKDNNVNVDDMTDLQILKYNTGDKVFLVMKIKLVDTMEEFTINIYL